VLQQSPSITQNSHENDRIDLVNLILFSAGSIPLFV
jgi:hypothetical protein